VGPQAGQQPLRVSAVVIRIVGQIVAMPEFPELSDYVVPSDFDGQYVVSADSAGIHTTLDKRLAHRFNGAEGALTVLPRLSAFAYVLEPADA
jgi:hypothetical protein